MPTSLPTDFNNNPIPALRFKTGGSHTINVTQNSVQNTVPFDDETKVISLYSTGPVYIKFGTDGVEATDQDHYFPGFTYYDVAIGEKSTGHFTHLAVIRAEQDCTLYISEKE